jgi:hypothetical protein
MIRRREFITLFISWWRWRRAIQYRRCIGAASSPRLGAL